MYSKIINSGDRMGTITGRKDILKSALVTDWRTVDRWIRDESFPAVKIDGRWYSDTDDIRNWFRGRIKDGCQGVKT